MAEPLRPAGHDFDHWAALARSDPEAFENERARVIEAAIGEAPPQIQPRLRGLQWKLDQIRKSASTPMVASLLMNRLLWDAVTGEDGLIERLNDLQSPGSFRHKPRHRAEILPFPPGRLAGKPRLT